MHRFMRITPERFEHLFSLVKAHLETNTGTLKDRRAINAKEKLAVTIHHLATGDSAIRSLRLQTGAVYGFTNHQGKATKLLLYFEKNVNIKEHTPNNLFNTIHS